MEDGEREGCVGVTRGQGRNKRRRIRRGSGGTRELGGEVSGQWSPPRSVAPTAEKSRDEVGDLRVRPCDFLYLKSYYGYGPPPPSASRPVVLCQQQLINFNSRISKKHKSYFKILLFNVFYVIIFPKKMHVTITMSLNLILIFFFEALEILIISILLTCHIVHASPKRFACQHILPNGLLVERKKHYILCLFLPAHQFPNNGQHIHQSYATELEKKDESKELLCL